MLSPLGQTRLSPEEHEYRLSVQRITQKVLKFTGSVSQAQRLVEKLESSDGEQAKSTVSSVLQQHIEQTRSLAHEASDDLKRLALSLQNDNQAHKLQNHVVRQRQTEQQKLSSDFKRVLDQFSRVSKSAAEQIHHAQQIKQEAIAINIEGDGSNNGSTSPGHLSSSPMYQQRQLQRQAQQQLLDNEVAFNEQLIAEREQDIVEIERGIVEVNEIFRDLGTIVTEQTPLFDNIESNVHIVDTHIENAVGELDQADHYHRQSRKNALYLMLIVIFVGTVLIIANSG